ncbi:NAD-dependent epimerase/dehydratase family protein [Candidatus Marinimicrobia bacterium MT.SAG.4]|nr:NAD-dependent epimerase/dehydratase family protein [Candidatus Marinimicrobia bacterium MT.SAG.4]
MKILVTGGAGFIASHIVDKYSDLGHRVEVIDDMSHGEAENKRDDVIYHEIDIRSPKISEIFDKGEFDVVNHHAAQMDVRKSTEDPAFDADVNIIGGINLLQNCVRTNVKQFIFASTGGAIYGEQDVFPADETHPANPVSPYGIPKLSIEKYLHYYHVEHGLTHTILRYSNVYGPRQNPHGEAGVIAIFAKKLLKGEQVIINGDGKQTRDYIYIDDIVRLNELVLGSEKCTLTNAGRGMEYDVNYLFNLLKGELGSSIEAEHGPPVAGEQRRSSINSDRAMQVFSWKASVDLESGISRTADFFKMNTES